MVSLKETSSQDKTYYVSGVSVPGVKGRIDVGEDSRLVFQTFEAIKGFEKDSKRYRDNRDKPSWAVDSHALHHLIGGYRMKDSWFCFLNNTTTAQMSEGLLDRHVETRLLPEAIKELGVGMDSAVIAPICRYNLDNLINYTIFPFKPNCLNNVEYLAFIKKQFPIYNFDEHIWIHFLESKSPVDFYLEFIKEKKRLPVGGKNFVGKEGEEVLDILNNLRGFIDNELIDNYLVSVYGLKDGSTPSVEELKKNFIFSEEAKNVEVVESGVFVDVDGTLIIDGKLNTSLVEVLQQIREKVTIFTGGLVDQKTRLLQSLGFTEKFLPVVSKDGYKGKLLEKVIDDTNPGYQGFDAVLHFTPRHSGQRFSLAKCSRDMGFGGGVNDLVEDGVLGKKLINKFLNMADNSSFIELIGDELGINVNDILRKLKIRKR